MKKPTKKKLKATMWVIKKSNTSIPFGLFRTRREAISVATMWFKSYWFELVEEGYEVVKIKVKQSK